MKTQTLYKGKWFNVIEKEDDNGASMVGIKCHTEGIVVLPYILNNMGEIEKFGINYECNPLRPEGYWNTCITGGIDEGEDGLQAAKRELLEESGYKQDDNEKWQYLGSLFISKLVDTEHPCFAVDITDLKQQQRKGDGTKNEEQSKFKLVAPYELMTEEDGFILSMLMKFFVRNYGGAFQVVNKMQS